MKKRHLDFDELYQLYVIQGMSQIQIAKHFHCGKNTVHDHLVQYKIPMRSQRKYQLREDYFDDVNSQEKAWLLGFLYADGYNNERKGDIKIRLALQDQEILERIRELLYIGELPPLSYLERQNYKYVELRISSKRLSKALAKCGCMQAKTFKVIFPFWLDQSLWRHFIRGVFDGDGCIQCVTLKSGNGAGSHKTMFSIVGHEPFIDTINEIIAQSCGLKPSKLSKRADKDSRLATLNYSGCRQCMKIRDFLYLGYTISLKRKADKFSILGTSAWRTYDTDKPSAYVYPIKLTALYNDPEIFHNIKTLRCDACGTLLVDGKIKKTCYDYCRVVYCSECLQKAYPDLYRSITSKKSVKPLRNKPTENTIKRDRSKNPRNRIAYIVYKDKRKKGKVPRKARYGPPNEIVDAFNGTSWMIVGNDVVLVDTEDVPRIKQYRWHIEQGRVLRSTRNPKITTYLNRYIVNAQRDETVYFKSTNRFDLRKDNLLVIRKEENYE